MKKATRPYDFGPCHVCGSKMRRATRDELYRVRRGWILLRAVPVGLCSSCGARVTTAAVAKRVQALMNTDRGRIVRIRALKWSAG